MSGLLPQVLARSQQQDGLRLKLQIDAGLMIFQGHFEDFPLVPGIAQVDWALRFASDALGTPAAALELRHLKFLRVMRPGSVLTLDLTLSQPPAGPRLSFRYSDAAGLYSQGEALLPPKECRQAARAVDAG